MKKRTLFYKTRLLSITLMLFGISFNQASAKTAYQAKVEQIIEKYIQLCNGINASRSPLEAVTVKVAVAEIQRDIREGMNIYDSFINHGCAQYLMRHSVQEATQFKNNLKNELEQAEKLKTDVDFQLEREIKAKKEQEAYEKTGAGRIQKNIKTAFEEWNQKGEFEKQTDYEERLKTKSQEMFSQICVEQIKAKLPDYNDTYIGNSYGHLRKDLSPYDVDNECFIVNFEINKIKWTGKVKVLIANAEKFKKEWDYFGSRSRFYGFGDYVCEINEFDWCFIKNELCPTLVTLENQKENTKYEFPLSLGNQSEITYSFDDLGINNPYLKGYIFKYSEAKALDEKINAEYNNKLEAVFQDYNRQLLENPYNIEKTVMPDYKKVTTEKDKEKSYNESLNFLKNRHENITRNLERSFREAYDSRFATREEFGEFYKSGKEVLNKEIERRKQIESEIETDKKLNNEWSKNRQYFKTKTEFYDAYVSDNYKQILREKKKK